MDRHDFLSVLGAGIATPEILSSQGGRPLAPGEVRPARPLAPPHQKVSGSASK